MKKMLFSAIAMVAFTLTANAQGSTKKENDCIQKGFEASDQAEKDGKKGGEIADAADKAYSDCMGGSTTVVSEPKGSKTATGQQPNTISR